MSTDDDEGGVQRKITAATGFCELGMWQEAWDELETLPAAERADPSFFGFGLASSSLWSGGNPRRFLRKD